MAHDGKYGYEVFELELPYSIVERYCVKRNPPNSKAMALSIVETRVVMLEQTPVGYHHRPDTDPSRDGGPLE